MGWLEFLIRQVTKYTDAIKASVLSKALAPNAAGVIELAKKFNIPKGLWKTMAFGGSVAKIIKDVKRRNSGRVYAASP